MRARPRSTDLIAIVFPLMKSPPNCMTQLEIKTLTDIDGNLAAIAWVVHHGYYGALPMKALVKGLRLRRR